MKNKMAWILSIILLCGVLEPIEAKVKGGKEQIKEKKPKKHKLQETYERIVNRMVT